MPAIEESSLARIFLQKISVDVEFEKVEGEGEEGDSAIRVYKGRYSVRFEDLARLNLSKQVFCAVKVCPELSREAGEEEVEEETSSWDNDYYLAFDGRSRFRIHIDKHRLRGDDENQAVV